MPQLTLAPRSRHKRDITPRAHLARTIGRVAAVALAVLGLAVGSVAYADEDPGPPGTVRQSLIAGTTVSAQEQQLRGLVTLNGGTCSGVLLANDWVLTAGHCIASRVPTATTVTLTGTARTSDAFYQFGGGLAAAGNFLDLRYGPDLALVHLSQPFSMAGSTTNFSNRLYAGSPASLNGQTIATYGQGISIYAQPGMPPLPPQGAGTWRAADLTVSATVGKTYTVGPNAQGQVTAFGDSGGPGFIWEDGVPYITGIQSRSVPVCNNATPALCQQTVTGITSSTVTSVPAVRDWIAAVLTTQWHPTATSEPIYVQAAEIAGTGWGLTDANQVGWAQAARAAAAMCYNRGFVGGHFDGHQDVAKGGYGIQCSGSGATWYDMSAAAMDARWAFTDVNDVSWAQANRVAERYCATRNQGFAGGHFNGHMAPAVGIVPARYGIFCYKDGAQWFDATDAQLAATGFGFATPKLDDVIWAQAARAAVGFCRGKGFSGGFMNGHQAPNKYGVVCQSTPVEVVVGTPADTRCLVCDIVLQPGPTKDPIADLTVVSIAGPTTRQSGLSGTYTVTIKNQGDKGATVELIVLFAGKLDQTGQIVAGAGLACEVGSDAGINAAVRCTGGTLDPGQTTTVVVQGRGQNAGTGMLVATLNPSRTITESDYDNNLRQLNVTIS